MSGFRRDSDHKAVFNTPYPKSENGEAWPNIDILLPISEILTLSRFDEKLHNRFVNSNLTLVEGINYTTPDDESDDKLKSQAKDKNKDEELEDG